MRTARQYDYSKSGEQGSMTRDEKYMAGAVTLTVVWLGFPTIAHPALFASMRALIIRVTLEMTSRPMTRMEGAPIPQVGIPRAIEGFDRG